jgi:plastocyanin
MSIFKRDLLVKLPVLGMLALAAACGGGGDEKAADATTPDAAAPAPPPTSPEAPAATGQGQVHEVRMVTTQNGASGVFEPANITVRRGDTIRWINDGGAAHNASFPPAENAGAANLPGPGPYLTTAGQTYEIQVSMDPGTYNYQCDPHALMGRTGTITVQ